MLLILQTARVLANHTGRPASPMAWALVSHSSACSAISSSKVSNSERVVLRIWSCASQRSPAFRSRSLCDISARLPPHYFRSDTTRTILVSVQPLTYP